MEVIRYFAHLAAAIIAALLGSCTAAAQNKYLPAQDYGKWHSFAKGPSSADGSWNCYTMKHTGGIDTLYVKNIRTGKVFGFAGATEPRLTPDGSKLAMRLEDSLRLLDTKTGRALNLGKTARFDFTADGKQLLAHGDDKVLRLYEAESAKVRQEFENVAAYSANGQQIALITERDGQQQLQVYTRGGSAQARASTANQYSGLQWSQDGSALAFYEARGETVVKLHHVSNRHGHRELAVETALARPVPKTRLHLPGNGEAVFFDVERPVAVSDAVPDLYIWRGSSPDPRPAAPYPWPYWHAWWPANGRTAAVEDEKLSNAVLTGDARHALLRTEDPYLPFYKYRARYYDMYLKELATGRITPIAKMVSDEAGTAAVSPGGKYIAYYKHAHWWVYDIATKTHRRLTTGGQGQWEKGHDERDSCNEVYGAAGWSKGDRDILLYDRQDVWRFPLDGSKPARLTQGREKNSCYRMESDRIPSVREGQYGFKAPELDLVKGLLLKVVATDTGKQGVALWDEKNGLKDLTLKDRKVLYAKRTGDGRAVQLMESAFDVSPRWYQLDADGTESEIAQANKQQKDYAWGRSELVYYNSGGKSLKGVLCYPANFDPKNKYPMVVYIYEQLSQRLHEYEAPSLADNIGFNHTSLSLDGYFVLMPDIAFGASRPGRAALRSVTAAVEEVLQNGFIDRDRIALMGHSFGGFETAYIASQTKMFKTAIAGAGLYNLRASYLGMHVGDKPHIELSLAGQMRNPIPFDDADFDGEAPINNVNTIETPLLLWAGAADTNVPAWHSTQLHMALWMKEKKNTLLVYEGEDHELAKQENREDLNRRIRQWLDHYLKGGPKPEWMQ